LKALAILATIAQTSLFEWDMQTLSARDAKYNFGRLIDMARAEPVTVEKHGRAVVVVLAIEEYERLKTIELEQHAKAAGSGDKK
jgi:prevent-host-death family protein